MVNVCHSCRKPLPYGSSGWFCPSCRDTLRKSMQASKSEIEAFESRLIKDMLNVASDYKDKVSRTNPSHGDIYRHFKGKMYEIVECPVTHTETGEKFVCYRALYDNYGVYVRPLEMFMSEVDKEKYPNAGQKYRFERIVQMK